MPLHLNVDRRLTRLAADAAHIESAAGVRDRPWCRIAPERHDRPSGDAESAPVETVDDHSIGAAIETAVAGEADELHDVLTDDAVGWSPTSGFTSRAEAERERRERDGALEILGFRIIRLLRADSVAVAEWEADASLAAPVLVGDDVLIDADGRRVRLSGVSVADLRDGRISAIHTYFDEAAIIEQVVLDR